MSKHLNSEYKPQSIQYTEVKKSQLAPKSLNKPYETYLSRTRNNSPQDLHEKSLWVIKLLAELNDLEPNPRVNTALLLGKEMIRSALEGSDFVPNLEDMKVVFLSPEAYKVLRGTEASSGVMIPGIDIVFVKVNPQEPDFFTASKAFHELVHRWVDKQHHVFHSEIDEDEDSRNMSFEIRRVGLMIRRLVRDPITGEVTDTEFLGELINELGNFAWQGVFIEKVLSDLKMRALFEDEITFRDNKLHDMFGESKAGYITVTIPDENGREVTVAIHSKNLFWDNTGKMKMETITLIMQLIDNLSLIVEKVGKLDFISVLVSLKTRPEQQHYLKEAVNDKLGEGFYYKLRRASYYSLASLLDLLSEVQAFLQL